MRGRHNRLAVVKELIKNNKIDNQDALLEMLRLEGFSVTQATLSRDLKMLKVGKISDGWSGYYYALPEKDLISESEKSYIQDVRRGILSIEFSGNFGVVKTRPGHANSVGIALDILALPEILGTLAGDDTIFLILREGMTKEDLLESFKIRIPEITD
ncbi:arginine repressor [Parasphaerochaeta coccoides]|uniref:Arginine repressor n=1 Tax=Parasphaerochaeta coccoides (strain ATCC BAA-1237 / DSM 17374 / SPN1) TaxID=760011 RepID=F4GLU2_PARC1|nr:ArgR family transcriptional regulator [Parasphaerochaeta coccoides]AEC02983.1 arginine repressor, ArgR [Parasphaerochaeta coccoides DSM 17374]